MLNVWAVDAHAVREVQREKCLLSHEHVPFLCRIEDVPADELVTRAQTTLGLVVAGILDNASAIFPDGNHHRLIEASGIEVLAAVICLPNVFIYVGTFLGVGLFSSAALFRLLVFKNTGNSILLVNSGTNACEVISKALLGFSHALSCVFQRAVSSHDIAASSFASSYRAGCIMLTKLAALCHGASPVQ